LITPTNNHREQRTGNVNTLQPAALSYTRDQTALTLCFSGDWLLGNIPAGVLDEALHDVDGSITHILFDISSLGNWNSGLVAALVRVRHFAEAGQLNLETANLPAGARSLLELAFAVKEREGARRTQKTPRLIETLGSQFIDILDYCRELTSFLGELILSAQRFIRGKATYQSSAGWLTIQEAGVEALPIVGLISFLIGMIFAFVGVMQLVNFGAGIYTADLVAVAMVREMAPIMTAILMAGRTGAAYAAHIGTMKVNEEIDALQTLGVNPIDFLVLPRVFALIIMMPFLTMYASLLGIIGGLVVAVSMLDVTAIQYIMQTNSAISMSTLLGGLFKSVIYGALVAIAGTQQGIACGNSAMAVGQATTKAVVMGIVMIVVSASVLTVVYVNLGI
jgi:phospholipid/cholesterol/gamma-HCH transport system permease protein